jgi:hypothetical protein
MPVAVTHHEPAASVRGPLPSTKATSGLTASVIGARTVMTNKAEASAARTRGVCDIRVTIELRSMVVKRNSRWQPGGQLGQGPS